MYFTLYHALLFYIKCYYTAVLSVSNILLLGGIDEELTFLGNGIELELIFLETKGIGIDLGIDKKELERNLEMRKRNRPRFCLLCPYIYVLSIF